MDTDRLRLSYERFFFYGLFFPVSLDFPFSDRNFPLQNAGRQESFVETGIPSSDAPCELDWTAFSSDLSDSSAASVSAGERDQLLIMGLIIIVDHGHFMVTSAGRLQQRFFSDICKRMWYNNKLKASKIQLTAGGRSFLGREEGY